MDVETGEEEAVSPGMAPSGTTASDPLPFVGRDAEFHRVLSAVDAAAAGVGCLALVAGEAGIGKSTLLREVGAEAGRRGLIVRRGRAVGRATAPLWIWRRAMAGTPAEHELEELTDQSGDPEGSDEVWRALSIVFDELHRRPDARASVLLFDDLQWADSASLLLLSHVTAELPVMPVAVVGTHRPVVDTETPLAKPLGEFRSAVGTVFERWNEADDGTLVLPLRYVVAVIDNPGGHGVAS